MILYEPFNCMISKNRLFKRFLRGQRGKIGSSQRIDLERVMRVLMLEVSSRDLAIKLIQLDGWEGLDRMFRFAIAQRRVGYPRLIFQHHAILSSRNISTTVSSRQALRTFRLYLSAKSKSGALRIRSLNSRMVRL